MMASDERARVLVVDDEPSICRALTMVFSRAGYYVRAIERGRGRVDTDDTRAEGCSAVER